MPPWARLLLAGSRTHHRPTGGRVEDSLFDPLMAAGARHLHAHTHTHTHRLLEHASTGHHFERFSSHADTG